MASATSWRVAAFLVLAQVGVVGAINLTGDWYTVTGNGDPVVLHFVQNGTSLTSSPILGASGSGTIDSATGAFTLQFGPPTDDFPRTCAVGFSAQADPSGATFIGMAHAAITDPGCPSISCACGETVTSELRGSRTPCGNGAVDPGEQCDDGNLGRNADCCALGCTLRPDGASCDDDLFCDGQETICQAGACQGGAVPCPPPLGCDEAHDVCFATQAHCASAPVNGCQPALGQHSKLTLKNSATNTKDGLAWTWVSSAAVPDTDFADPVTGPNDYAVCVYDPRGRQLNTRAPEGGVCGTKPCWKRTKSSFTYRDPLLDPDGLLKVVLKPGAAGKAKITVKGRGELLAMPGLPLMTPVRVQILRGLSTSCWEATFSTSTRNDAEVFKARSDP